MAAGSGSAVASRCGQRRLALPVDVFAADSEDGIPAKEPWLTDFAGCVSQHLRAAEGAMLG
jgi:hypothetical protein